MKHAIPTYWLMVAILALPAGVFAQSLAPQVVASGGGSGTVSGVSLDFTIGEAVTTTATAGSTTLTQGFQQPPVVETVGREDVVPSAGQLVLYPNPSAGNTFLRVDAPQHGELQLVVYDAVGKRIYANTRQLTGGEQHLELPTATLSAGHYTVAFVSAIEGFDGQYRKLIIVR